MRSTMTGNNADTDHWSRDDEPTDQSISRRGWLKLLGAGTALLGGASRADAMPDPPVGTGENDSQGHGTSPFDLDDRIDQVESEREAARESLVSGLTEYEHTRDIDEVFTVELYGQEFAPFLFTKGMPLETDENGRPYPEGLVAYDRKLEHYWQPILEQGDINESVERGGERLFIGVPAVHTVTHSGMDPWRGTMPPAPDPTGVRNAGEMIDLYAMEQLRDVPFVAYPNEPGGEDRLGSGLGTASERTETGGIDPGGGNRRDSSNSDNRARRRDNRSRNRRRDRRGPGGSERRGGGTLNALQRDLESVENELDESWWYDTDRLFVEADTDEIDWGPYLSQYLLHDVNMWALPIEQQYRSYEAGVDHNGTRPEWLRTLEGRDEHSAEINPNEPKSDETSYISTGRDLATIVNAEPPYQEYLIAGLHLLENGSFADGLPYNARNEGDIFSYGSSGPTGFLDLLARGARQALLAAFYQKYYVHFRCRPETYSGRLHSQRQDGRDFGISEVLTNASILSVSDNQDLLPVVGPDFLSTVYEEGSPVHPAYPSGHSVIAGTCGTILKVMFQNTDWEDDYYVPSPDGTSRETVPVPSGHHGTHQEIDKLMSNIGLARMFAGVHYYSDHYHGVKLGEQVAVGLLLDVFERAHTGSEELTATFTPFLDYDTEYDISIDTLETLREQATSR